MANPSLSEYIAQSQRGLYQSVFGPGFMKKAGAGVGTPFTVDTATGRLTPRTDVKSGKL